MLSFIGMWARAWKKVNSVKQESNHPFPSISLNCRDMESLERSYAEAGADSSIQEEETEY